MRYPASEKLEIIRLVEQTAQMIRTFLLAAATVARLKPHRSQSRLTH